MHIIISYTCIYFMPIILYMHTESYRYITMYVQTLMHITRMTIRHVNHPCNSNYTTIDTGSGSRGVQGKAEPTGNSKQPQTHSCNDQDEPCTKTQAELSQQPDRPRMWFIVQAEIYRIKCRSQSEHWHPCCSSMYIQIITVASATSEEQQCDGHQQQELTNRQ